MHLERLEDRWCPSGYNIIDIGTFGGPASQAYAVNNAGKVVGYMGAPGPHGNAFLWDDGVITNLGTLAGGTTSVAHDINDAGQVVGWSDLSGGSLHAFLWQDGAITDLGISVYNDANNPLAINNAGVVVGRTDATVNGGGAFVWENGVYNNLNTLLPVGSPWVLWAATDVNNNKQIAGWGTLNGQYVGFLYVDDDGVFSNGGGQIVSLGTLGGASSFARALNDAGQVTGESYLATGAEYHAFRWTPNSPNGTTGTMKDLGTIPTPLTYEDSAGKGINDSGYVVGTSSPMNAFIWPGKGNPQDLNNQIPGGIAGLDTANAINNAGVIVAHGQDEPGHQRGFILIPAPSGTLSLAINDVTVTEGDVDTTNAVFTVTLSGSSSQTVTVNYATGSNTAVAGTDFVAVSGTLTFAPGQTSKTITVPIIGDTLLEPDETFFVNLGKPVNAVLGDLQGQGTILDNEPRLTINDVTVTEGNSGTTPAVFTVTLSVGSSQTVTVDYATESNAAVAGSDFLAVSGTLTFTPGQRTQTITVPIIGDTVKEGDEVYYVRLSNAVNAFLLDATGQGIILNDDKGGKALTAASSALVPVAETLSQAQVQPLLTEAIARWSATGVNTARLAGIQVVITNLPGGELGEAAGHTIWLDSNAAGWGWFYATPGDDSEFTTPGDQGEQNRMDLLTVLMHEIGHVLGHDHEADGVMQEALAAGTRMTPGSATYPADLIAALLSLADPSEATLGKRNR